MKLKKLFRALALCTAGVLACAVLTACGDKGDSSSQASAADTDKKFVITLYANDAPITCENFEKLVKEKFYDGLTFHRVVDGFMAQGGDPNGDGTGGSKETIKGEFSANGVENSLSHTRGVVSMARANDMDSASSQFFICYSDKDTFLDGQYAAFGMVTEGMDVVDAMACVETTKDEDGNDTWKPTEDAAITIEKVTITTYPGPAAGDEATSDSSVG